MGFFKKCITKTEPFGTPVLCVSMYVCVESLEELETGVVVTTLPSHSIHMKTCHHHHPSPMDTCL